MNPLRLAAPALAWLLALFLPAPSWASAAPPIVARDTLQGRVADSTGRTLPGATITVQELDRTAVADSSGAWRMTDLPAGTYTIVVRLPGYASQVRRVTLGGSASVDATLALSALRLPDVTVTAARSPLEAFVTPLPVSTPTPAMLAREYSISLAHAIDGLPGLHSLTTGGQIGKPVIRGFAGSRVLVVQNGLRLEDYSWSDEDGPSVDARLANRIEVIRGPASLLYGSDAMGGVINVIPTPLPEVEPGQSLQRGSAELYFGSNSRELGTVLSGEGARGGMGWRLTAIGRRAEALHTPEGELENTGFEAVNGEAAVGWHGPWGSASARYARYGGEFKLLEAGGPPPGVVEGEEGGPERKMADDRIQVSASLPMRGFRLEPRLQWQRHWLSELADAAEVGGSGFIETTIFDLVLSTLTADVLAHFDVGDRARLTSGVSGTLQSNDSRAESPGLPFVPDASGSTVAAFGVGQLQVGRLSLLGGARVDHRALSADATPALQLAASDLSHTAVSGNAGASFEVAPGAAITLNVGRAWRAPNLFELFANGPLLAEGRYVIGDGSLDPEYGTNVDGGFRWASSWARVDLSAFRNDVSDYVFLQPTAEMRPAPGSTTDSLRVFRYQAGKAVLTGAEVGVEVDPTGALALRARYDVVRGTETERDEPLPLMPPARIDLETELHGDHVGPLGRSYVRLGVEINRRPTRLNPLDVPTDGYALLHVGGGADFAVGGLGLHLDVAVRNAADKAYRSFLSRYKEFALDPGRDIVVRLRTGL